MDGVVHIELTGRSNEVFDAGNFSRTSMIDEFECYDSIFPMEMQIKFVML